MESSNNLSLKDANKFITMHKSKLSNHLVGKNDVELQVENFSKMVIKMMTIRPSKETISSSSRHCNSLGFEGRNMFKTRQDSSMQLPKRMPSFV